MKVLKEQKGFTLVELLIAMSILAIVSIPVSKTLVNSYKNIYGTGQESQELFQHQGDLEILFSEFEIQGTKVIPLTFSNNTTVEVKGDVINSGGLSAYVISEVVRDDEEPEIPVDPENPDDSPPVIVGDVCPRTSKFQAPNNNNKIFDFMIQVRHVNGGKINGLGHGDFRIYQLLPNGYKQEITVKSVAQVGKGNSGNYRINIDLPSGIRPVTLVAEVLNVELQERAIIKK